MSSCALFPLTPALPKGEGEPYPVSRQIRAVRLRVFGRPLSTEQELEERLPKWKALPVFSSDVMSSVAYATQASLFTLLAVGTIAFGSARCRSRSRS